MNDNYTTCEVCKTDAPREWRLIEKPYYNRTRRSVLCPACYIGARQPIRYEGWEILPGVLVGSWMNGSPITDDVIMQQPKPSAQ